MGNINKTLPLLIILVFTIPLLTLAESASAQQTLSTPQFTVYFTGQSYDVPATASVDPYTGANVTIPSHFVTNGTIFLVVTNDRGYIFNQLNTPTQNYASTYYFRMKGHFGAENWTDAGQAFSYGSFYGNNGTFVMYSHTVYYYQADSYPPNAQIDFQVKVSVTNDTSVPYNPNYPNTNYYQVSSLYAASDWSDTQTVTISNSTLQPPYGYGGPVDYWGPTAATSIATPSPTASPTNPSLNPTSEVTTIPNNSQSDNQQSTNIVLIVAVAVLGIAVVSLLVYVRGIRNRLPKQ